MVSPIDAFTPIETTIVARSGDNLNFSLDLVHTLPISTLSTSWTLNGAAINTNSSSAKGPEGTLLDGANILMVAVQDFNPMLRINNHSTIHIYIVLWIINYNATIDVIDAEGSSANSTSTAFPNSVDNVLNISVTNFLTNDLSAAIYSLDGKLIKNQNSNNHDSLQIDMENLSFGIYIVKY